MLESIRSYLVDLGFAVDKRSFDTGKKAMDTMESSAGSLASTVVKGFGAAAVAIAAFGVAAATASAKFLNGLASQQIQMEILSRQLWTTEQQANAFNATLKAMGTNLQSLYLSPTLMSQYQQLHSVANQLSTPGDYQQQIQQIQNIKLQFEQMKVEAYYALQWVGYYFTKYMNGPIEKVHNILQQINQVIIKKMPSWTKQAAQWMASFWQAGLQIVTGIKDVYHWLQKIGSYIPGWAKAIGTALAIFSISNPFMLFVEGIGAAFLLWNDWQTYLKDPSKSAFPKLWAWVEKLNKKLSGLHVGVKVANDVKNAFDKLSTTVQNVRKFIVHLYNTFHSNGSLKSFGQSVTNVANSVKVLGSGINNLITGIGHLFNLFTSNGKSSDMTGFFQLLMNMATASINLVADSIRELGDFAGILGSLAHGNWKGAWKAAQDFATTFQQQMTTTVFTPQGMGYGPVNGPKSYPYMWSTSSGSSSGSTSNSNQSTTVNAPLSITNNNYGNTNTSTTNQQMTNHFNKLIHNFRPTY